MNRFLLRLLTALAFVLMTGWLIAEEQPQLPARSASDGRSGPSLALRASRGVAHGKDDVQDFVFLAEARPLLVRVHVRVDGKPLSAAWNELMKYLFAYLDINGDGVLSKEEAERAPGGDQLTRPLNSQNYANVSALGPTMTVLDADKDGKVSLDELAAYYRKDSMPPFQFQFDNVANEGNALAALYLGGNRPDPEVEKVRDAVFALLDTDKDGKLTQREWDAAPALLLARDENEDEIIVAQEVVPAESQKKDRNALMMMLGRPRNGGEENPLLVPISVSGQAPPKLARRFRERYDPSGKKPEVKSLNKSEAPKMMRPSPANKEESKAEAKPKGKEANKEDKKEPLKKLTRQQLRLDAATFAQLDADRDGALDDNELAAFVRRDPDLCLTVSFGDKTAAPLALTTVKGHPAPLADKVCLHEERSRLDLGSTRLELWRGEEKKLSDKLQDFAKTQFSALFKRADKDNNGYLDAKEAKTDPIFRNLFQQIDRDGDGKVYEKELLTYFDHLLELERRAAAGCVTLVLRNQSRGLFDLLDTDRDDRLSVREIKQTPQLLAARDCGKRGFLRKEDIPASYRLTLRLGLKRPTTGIQEAIIVERLFGEDTEEPAKRGPTWFRKMDRNRDGDVSRKEFLFGEDLFRKLDADGDGLLSVEEAEKAAHLPR